MFYDTITLSSHFRQNAQNAPEEVGELNKRIRIILATLLILPVFMGGVVRTADAEGTPPVFFEDTYTYDLASDGTPSVFPLQSGNGSYRFRVMENVVDKKYSELCARICEVRLLDEFQPFLRPSSYVNYRPDSECVKKAEELIKGASDDASVVKAVYNCVCESVKYDREKAASVKSGYLPDPDETLRTGKGICFDYAALAASMLRSQGIPTKMVFGYVAPKDLYHAWNMFYTEETGWVTVTFSVNPKDWTRIDLTFSANGADSNFIGDGSNYSDVYYY